MTDEWDGVDYEDQAQALRDAYAVDPLGTDLQVIAAVAQQTRDELTATLTSSHYNDVAASQYEIAAGQAVRAVREKFTDFDKVEAKVVQKLRDGGSHLIPESMSPKVLEEALTDVVRLAALDVQKEDEENYAQRIQDADLRRYR